MHIKPLVFATLAFLAGSFGMALAQESSPITGTAPPALPPEISMAAHNILTQGGKVSSGSRRVSADSLDRVAAATIAPAYGVGWNLIHATHCLTYYAGTYTWLYVYPVEGGIFYTNVPAVQNAFGAPCALGNYVAIYITSSTGTWDRIYTYDYK